MIGLMRIMGVSRHPGGGVSSPFASPVRRLREAEERGEHVRVYIYIQETPRSTMDEYPYLWIERLSETELLSLHLQSIKDCMKYDLWKDISMKPEYILREQLGTELRIRMGAE